MLTILVDKIGSFAQWRGIELTWSPLRVATLCDEFGKLQYLEVLGHGWRADGERLGQLGDRSFAQCELRQNRAPRWISERGEGDTQRVGSQVYYT